MMNLERAEKKTRKRTSGGDLKESPNLSNNDLCRKICGLIKDKNVFWEELKKRGPEKEDFFYLMTHLRNRDFLRWHVWPYFEKERGLTEEDMKKILRTQKIDSFIKNKCRRMLKKLPKEDGDSVKKKRRNSHKNAPWNDWHRI